MAITNVPVEVLDIIASDLNRKDLWALNRTCRTLHNVTQRLLYEYITPTATWENPSLYRFKDDDGTRYLSSLVLGLVYHPELHYSVKGAFLRLCQDQTEKTHCQTSWKGTKLEWTEENYIMAEAVLRNKDYSFIDSARLIQALRIGKYDAFITLALLLMPRVTSLVIGDHSTRRGSPFTVPLILKMGEKFRIESKAPIFSFLTALTGCTEACQLNFLPDFDAFQALLYFPKLQSLSATVHEPRDVEWPHGIIPVSPIKDLTLRYSEIRPPKIRQILAATPNLTSFAYSFVVYLDIMPEVAPEGITESDWQFKYGTWEDPHPSWPRFLGQGVPPPTSLDLSALADALEPIKSSLEALTLRIEAEYNYEATGILERLEDLAIGSLEELSTFTQLHTIDIPGHLLLHGNTGFEEVFPAESLRTLYVGNWTSARADFRTMDDVEYLEYLSIYLRQHHPPGRLLHIGIADAFLMRNDRISERNMLMHIRFCKERNLPYSVHSDVPKNTMRRFDSSQWVPSFNPALRGLVAVEDWWLEKIMRLLSHETITWEQGFRHVPLRDRQLFNYASGLDLSHLGWRYVEADRAFERLER